MKKRIKIFLSAVLFVLVGVIFTPKEVSAYDLSYTRYPVDTYKYNLSWLNKQNGSKIVKKADGLLVGSDGMLQTGNIDAIGKINVQKVAPGTKIQGYTVDDKFFPQDNIANLKAAVDAIAYAKISQTSFTFNGKEQRPKVTVYDTAGQGASVWKSGWL